MKERPAASLVQEAVARTPNDNFTIPDLDKSSVSTKQGKRVPLRRKVAQDQVRTIIKQMECAPENPQQSGTLNEYTRQPPNPNLCRSCPLNDDCFILNHPEVKPSPLAKSPPSKPTKQTHLIQATVNTHFHPVSHFNPSELNELKSETGLPFRQKTLYSNVHLTLHRMACVIDSDQPQFQYQRIAPSESLCQACHFSKRRASCFIKDQTS